MEVHHHPHGHGHKKKFKEYFLEFLMIFLAVTMGFFAESLREHITENKKEKEYIHGIVSDLTTDTVKLTEVIKYYDQIIPMLDSGRKHFSKLQQPGSLRTVVFLQYGLGGFKDFIYTDITLQQIKASGGMLLIKNKAVVDSILHYDAKVKVALISEKVLGELLVKIQHEMGGVLNMQPVVESFAHVTDPIAQKAIADSLNKDPKGFLLTHDPVAIGQFYNDYIYYLNVAILAKTEMAELKVKAARAISLLKKDYGLKGE